MVEQGNKDGVGPIKIDRLGKGCKGKCKDQGQKGKGKGDQQIRRLRNRA